MFQHFYILIWHFYYSIRFGVVIAMVAAAAAELFGAAAVVVLRVAVLDVSTVAVKVVI